MFNRKDKECTKRIASDTYNAFTLWLTAMFAIPLLITLLVGLPLSMYLDRMSLEYTSLIISLIALVPGTIYAVKYINENYFIKNRKKVIERAALIALLTYIFFTAVQIILIKGQLGLDIGSIVSTNEFFISSIGFLAKVGVFVAVASAKLNQD